MEKKEKRVCEVCGEEFLPKSRIHKVCNETCRKKKEAYKNFKRGEKFNGETMEDFIEKMSIPCDQCGRSFYKGELRRFWKGFNDPENKEKCCEDCYRDLTEKKREEEKIQQEERKRQRELEIQKNLKVCPECGVVFLHSNFKHCSMECWISEKHRQVEHKINPETILEVADIINEAKQNGRKIETVLVSGNGISIKYLNKETQ